MTVECCAVIPARGGSKGILRKNVRMLAGKPMIVHTIDAARAAQRVQRVVVSTDDPEIAQISRDAGADVLMRPEEISGDAATSESALIHVLDQLAAADYRPDLLAFLQCTSPLTAAEDIDATVASLIRQQADSAVAVTDFHYFVWNVGDDGAAEGINHDKAFRPRRQDREPQYLETGAVYVMNVEGFRNAGHRFFGKTAMHVMPAERVLEIDEPVDLDVAEVLMRARQSAEAGQRLPARVAGLAMDFDGVFTDNRVGVNQDGVETVVCSRSDSMGLEVLRKAGLPMVVISKEVNPAVKRRCEKLQIPCQHGVEDKRSLLLAWCEAQGVAIDQVVFVGNDINDVECLRLAGCGVVVADAHPEAKRSADLVLTRPGGMGALRELCDLIQQERQKP